MILFLPWKFKKQVWKSEWETLDSTWIVHICLFSIFTLFCSYTFISFIVFLPAPNRLPHSFSSPSILSSCWLVSSPSSSSSSFALPLVLFLLLCYQMMSSEPFASVHCPPLAPFLLPFVHHAPPPTHTHNVSSVLFWLCWLVLPSSCPSLFSSCASCSRPRGASEEPGAGRRGGVDQRGERGDARGEDPGGGDGRGAEDGAPHGRRLRGQLCESRDYEPTRRLPLVFIFWPSARKYLLPSAQRSRHQHLPGGRQAAVHAGGVGEEDPSLLRAGPGRPGHPAASRWVVARPSSTWRVVRLPLTTATSHSVGFILAGEWSESGRHFLAEGRCWLPNLEVTRRWFSFNSFNSAYFVQPNIINYKLSSEGFTVCTHRHPWPLTFDLTWDQEQLQEIEKTFSGE